MAVSKAFIVTLLLGMIFSGAANTLVYKTQNSFYTDQDEGTFNHPFMQAVTMFFGEFICIFLFFYFKTFQKEAYETEKQEAVNQGLNPKMNYLWLLIPAGADFVTSNLQYIALNYVAPSLYQMLRGGVILITALFTVVFLKRKLYTHNYIGCCFVIVGISLVGSSKYIFPQDSSDTADSSMASISIILILLSLITNGILFVSEEKLFSKYYLHPFQVVGTEGFWGLCFYIVFLPLLALINCPDALGDMCIKYENTSHLENPGLYFKQLANNPALAIYVVLGIFTIACFNICGVNVTKHISSLARSIVDVTRTLLVWIGSIIITKTYGANNGNFQWEVVQVGPILLEALGFIILVTGNLIYNKIIILPFAIPPTPEAEALLLGKDKDHIVSLQQQNMSRRSSELGHF